MAKNDIILIDTLLQQRSGESLIKDPGEVFEEFVLEQILKNFDLSQDELNFGWTDGSHDGGMDGFYVFVNGRLLNDPTDFTWPRSAAEIQVYLITCKHSSTFLQAPLDAMLASVQELFDLSKTNSELSGKYSPALKQCRDMFIAAFRQLSLYRPTLSFSIIYATRGETAILGDSISARGEQLISLLNSYFSASRTTFTTLGATELVELYRQVKSFSLDLPVQECLTAGQEGYVVLARLNDYCNFVRDERGELRRYLFDSNVRAFLGVNLVNKDIAETLNTSTAPNFWWLNNGVTILATSASLVGKTLKLKDIQIVNGLQTTESIHRHYNHTPAKQGDIRTLLVKVIVSQEESIRDQVIRATNNQSTVEPAALHATDRVQRNIEEILLKFDWFYERRTNYYRNEGRPENRILSPLVLATGSVALLLKNPIRSSKLRQKHLRSTEAYQVVYSDHFPLNAWPVVASLIRGAENAILRSSGKRVSRGKQISAWRGLLAYIAAVRLLGTYSYQLRELTSLNLSQVTDNFMNECWEEIAKVSGDLGSN
ncbi:MAG: AIPR family protein, partial [Nitrosomonas sp.]|nr:AIPR family protein [Nitrosomonas sp.]